MKRITYLLHITFIMALSVIVSPVSAQDANAISKMYPGESAVVQDKVLHYRIETRNGEPYVESRESQKLLYLTTNHSYLGRYSFYHSTFHEVREYAAYTQTATNKKIKVTDFQTSNSSSGSVFYDDAKETRFDFPSVASGATGNLEVSVLHTKPYLLSPFYFSRRIPVLKTELKITFTKDIGLKYVMKGIDTSVIKFRQEKRKNETTYIFSVENLPAEKDYPDAPDESWYMPHVIFYIDHYTNAIGQTVKYLSTADDLFKLNSSFIKDVNKVPGAECKRFVDSLTGKVKDPVEKTRLVYNWVQNHIKYIAFEDGMGGFVPRDPNLVLHRRYGDCKDMAGLLTLLLNTAGVPAYYTWIGTRDIAYSYHETPLPIVDNHMICVAKPGKELIFLDGTDANCVFGSVPAAIQDKEAMIAKSETEYEIVKVPVPAKNVNVKTDSTVLEITDNGLKGKTGIKLAGYYATEMQAYLDNVRESNREKFIKGTFSRGSNKYHLDKFKVGETRKDDALALDAEFTLQDYAKKLGDEWYINLNLLKVYESQEIDYPKRKIPVAKEFLFTNRIVTELKIPDGYTASYIPASKSFRNNIWGFDLTYVQKGNSIIYSLQFDNNHLLLNSDSFQEWNKVLEHLFPLYKESVILSKK